MKYLIITGVFVLGLSLGYVVGTQTAQNDVVTGNESLSQNTMISNDKDEDSNHNNQNHSDEESDLEITEIDSSDFISDSLMLSMMQDSSLTEDHISTEKLIKTITLSLNYLSEEVEQDTAIKDMLGIDEVKTNSVFVEFWESPLNFEGYKLSKKKLIVYGLSPQFDYKFYKDGSDYFLSYQNVYLKMRETQDFLPFAEVAKSEVFND
ncbi:MAG: hypothetical protein JNJ99_16545 [Crocinitomicaceae bacterium]|nr:hypothetical protein [Crocinitomicaceae bacterium]